MCDAPDISGNLVARNMLRDLVPCEDFDTLARSMGFVPASTDVTQIEHRQCHLRRKAIEPIVPTIIASANCAGYVAHGMAEFAEHARLSTDAQEAYVNLSRVTALAVIAHLVDFGILEVCGG